MTPLDQLAAEINRIGSYCDVNVVQYPGGQLAPCGKAASHTLTVVCPIHGARVGHIVCPDHASRLTEAARVGYLYRCGGGCTVHVETTVL